MCEKFISRETTMSKMIRSDQEKNAKRDMIHNWAEEEPGGIN